ncbi:MAG: hypothetical protein K1X92_18870 [Bacteroidia bacterium]|nr:hypothetical protein [Bacteroidia bacterium]
MNDNLIQIQNVGEEAPAVLEDIRKRKSNLIKALILSSGIDIAISAFELPFMVTFLGTPIIIDEIIEYFISRWIAGSTIDLKMRNRLIGLIPIPGVTSVSYQCIKELWKLRKEEKRLLEAGKV